MKEFLSKTKGMLTLHAFCLLAVVYLGIVNAGWGQGFDSLKKAVRYEAVAGGGVSKFNIYEMPSSPKYYTPEFSVGIRAIKPLGRVFSITTGLSFSAKFKRSPYFKNNSTGTSPYTTEPEANFALDNSTSKTNAYYLSLPLALNIAISPGTNMYGGLNGRSWFPRDNDYMDVLKSLKEYGFLVGTSTRINRSLSIGLEFFYGLTDIYHGAVFLPGSRRFVDLKVTNQSLMIFLSSSLSSKK